MEFMEVLVGSSCIIQSFLPFNAFAYNLSKTQISPITHSGVVVQVTSPYSKKGELIR